MSIEAKHYTVVDPRQLDGDPYEVAALAIEQAAALAGHYRHALEIADLMARNAEMERQLYFTGEARPEKYTEGPQGRKFRVLDMSIANAQETLQTLAKAASFDPKNPPRA